jgi:signal transduction histidine kinase
MLLTGILVVAAIYNLFLAFAIVTRTRQRQAGRNFAWMIVAITFWVLCEAAIDYPGMGKEQVILLSRAMFFLGVLMLTALLWFAASFPTPSRRFGQWATFLAGLGVPWLFLSWTTVLITDSTAPPWGNHVYGDQLLMYLYAAWLLACGVSAVGYLIRRAIKSRGLERLQILYILLGMAVLLVVGIAFDVVHPAITGASTYSSLGPLAAIVLSTTATYAIIRYRLLDIRIVLRAGLAYSITIGILSLLFALLVPAVDGFLKGKGIFPDAAASFAAALLMALAFQPLRRRIELIVGRFFLKSDYDYRQTLSDVGNLFASARESSLLVDMLTETLERTFHPQFVAVYLPRGDGTLQLARGIGEGTELPHALELSDSVVNYAVHSDEVLFAEEVVRQDHTREALGLRMQSWDAAIAVPLISADTLCGFALIGHKNTGDAYTAEDIGLLHILSKQSAVALDNVRHYEGLHLLNIELEQRVKERTYDLARANRQLTDADQAKDRFLATLSHELLSPLTGILGWVQLAQNNRKPGTVERAIRSIEQAALQQKYLVDELLDVSRIVHDKVRLDRQPAEIWTLAERAADGVQHMASEKEITLRLERPAEPVIVSVDHVRIVQVITNLLVNAVKFTPQGGTIILSATRSGETAIITVRDTGCGIAPEKQIAIFERFRQAEDGARAGGLGLGLTMVKGFVELHGGEVSVASDGEGRGSTFTFTLPIVMEKALPTTAATVNPSLPETSSDTLARTSPFEDFEQR